MGTCLFRRHRSLSPAPLPCALCLWLCPLPSTLLTNPGFFLLLPPLLTQATSSSILTRGSPHSRATSGNQNPQHSDCAIRVQWTGLARPMPGWGTRMSRHKTMSAAPSSWHGPITPTPQPLPPRTPTDLALSCALCSSHPVCAFLFDARARAAFYLSQKTPRPQSAHQGAAFHRRKDRRETRTSSAPKWRGRSLHVGTTGRHEVVFCWRGAWRVFVLQLWIASPTPLEHSGNASTPSRLTARR